MKNPNLNTVPYWKTSYNKKQKYKAHEHFHYRGDIKITGKETDMQECKECNKLLPLTAFTTQVLRSDGAWHLKKICRQCHTVNKKETYEVRKNATPKPERCACCHKKVEKLAKIVFEDGWKFNQVICIAKGGLRVGDVFSRLYIT